MGWVQASEFSSLLALEIEATPLGEDCFLKNWIHSVKSLPADSVVGGKFIYLF